MNSNAKRMISTKRIPFPFLPKTLERMLTEKTTRVKSERKVKMLKIKQKSLPKPENKISGIWLN